MQGKSAKSIPKELNEQIKCNNSEHICRGSNGKTLYCSSVTISSILWRWNQSVTNNETHEHHRWTNLIIPKEYSIEQPVSNLKPMAQDNSLDLECGHLCVGHASTMVRERSMRQVCLLGGGQQDGDIVFSTRCHQGLLEKGWCRIHPLVALSCRRPLAALFVGGLTFTLLFIASHHKIFHRRRTWSPPLSVWLLLLSTTVIDGRRCMLNK